MSRSDSKLCGLVETEGRRVIASEKTHIFYLTQDGHKICPDICCNNVKSLLFDLRNIINYRTYIAWFTGALLGFFTGAATGNAIGEHVDEKVRMEFVCGKCGNVVNGG